jgi:hypothetical protein
MMQWGCHLGRGVRLSEMKKITSHLIPCAPDRFLQGVRTSSFPLSGIHGGGRQPSTLTSFPLSGIRGGWRLPSAAVRPDFLGV